MNRTGRRDFIALSSLAAAGAVAGCATQKKLAWKPDEKAFIESMEYGGKMFAEWESKNGN